MAEEQAYHLGTTDQELYRLGFQHQAWQEETLKLWHLAGFNYRQHLLDLGCGPGFATLELARLTGPDGHVHALDASQRFVDHLQGRLKAERVSNVTPQVGDVHAIPLADESVDGVFARWLLCFVENPAGVCAEAARVLRPGGVFVAWDYFNYLSVKVYPEHPAIARLFDCYHHSALAHQGSYDIAQHLPRLMVDQGLQVEHLHPINRAARPGSLIWQWVELFNNNYLPQLQQQGLMSAPECDEFRAAWQQASTDPAAFFFPPPMLGIIARKPI